MKTAHYIIGGVAIVGGLIAIKVYRDRKRAAPGQQDTDVPTASTSLMPGLTETLPTSAPAPAPVIPTPAPMAPMVQTPVAPPVAPLVSPIIPFYAPAPSPPPEQPGVTTTPVLTVKPFLTSPIVSPVLVTNPFKRTTTGISILRPLSGLNFCQF